MEISEVFDNVSDSFKKGNGTLIVGIVFVVLFVIIYITQSKAKNTETVQIGGVMTSYPDVSENSDVIISSIQNSIDFQTEQIEDIFSDKFSATENYVKEGLEKTEKVSEMVGAMQDSMTTQFESLGTKVNNIKPTVQYVPVQTPQPTQDMSNFVTSNGFTVAQNQSLLGKDFKGSTITSVSTTGNGSTVIGTKDGQKYTVNGLNVLSSMVSKVGTTAAAALKK